MIFAFPGQGSQFVGMGKSLYSEFSVARQVFNEVDSILDRKLSHLIFNGPIEELTITEDAQPAIMAVSIAMLRVMEHVFGKSLFTDHNVKYVCGHSVGEYTALCAAGALTLESAIKLLKVRSEAMHEASLKCKGGMVALLGAEINEVEDILKSVQIDGICEIANDNGGGQVVISGTREALEMLPDLFKNSSVRKLIKLQVSGPFHSSLMKPADEKVLEFLKGIKITRPIVPLISNVTAKEESDPKVIKTLLAKQVVSRVKWREMVLYMSSRGINKFVETGPNKVLSNLVKRIDQSISTKNIDSIGDIDSFFNESLVLTAKNLKVGLS
ncbi:ACP S-malonyltransferase [Wolbachia endosymbiont of Muscidifurax uniraptor]|uniref:ACP S-malonyltransferase n=1 Tax=Wolbachia endosymbiont of Muscidifurax uniraptor TaxID=77037 RepID=UPI0001988AEE|nr:MULTISPECIES: ACP S-malonyltransferase [Wolbachia]EEH12408.1 malonyl CoA-acyl carrier protein transacylase [Wolbachia endosymbiont of Muscidifurax uniraptor]ONI56141.1 malonyl CoA-acyl carrier protein transacylase [Wolbachia pipientis wUni]